MTYQKEMNSVRTRWNGPLFSIVIATRERADTLTHAIRSVLSQDHDSFELVVMDNCNSLETVDAVAAFSDSRIRYVRAPHRLAMSDNWEMGLAHASGAYTLFIGDDDALAVGALRQAEHLINEFKTPLLTWRRPTYWWPRCTSTWLRDRLYLEPQIDQHRELPSQETLQRYYNMELGIFDVPMIYNSFVHRSVIERASAKHGRYFIDTIPDVSSGIVNLIYSQTFVATTTGLSIAGLSEHSNGTSHAVDGNRKGSRINQFHSENETFTFATPFAEIVPKEYMEGFWVNCMANTLAAHSGSVPPYQINIPRMMAYLIQVIHETPTKYDNTVATVKYLAKKYQLTLTPDAFPPRGQAPSPNARVSPEINEKHLIIDTSTLGVSNVYDAARLVDQVYQDLRQKTVDISEFSPKAPQPSPSLTLAWRGSFLCDSPEATEARALIMALSQGGLHQTISEDRGFDPDFVYSLSEQDLSQLSAWNSIRATTPLPGAAHCELWAINRQGLDIQLKQLQGVPRNHIRIAVLASGLQVADDEYKTLTKNFDAIWSLDESSPRESVKIPRLNQKEWTVTQIEALISSNAMNYRYKLFSWPEWDNHRTWKPVIDYYLENYRGKTGSVLILQSEDPSSVFEQVNAYLDGFGPMDALPDIELVDQMPESQGILAIVTGSRHDAATKVHFGERVVTLADLAAMTKG